MTDQGRTLSRLRMQLPAVITVLLVAAIAAGLVFGLRAQRQARDEAARAAARFQLGVDVRDRRTAMVDPAREANDAASSLRLTLLEYVTASDRDLDAVESDRARLEQRLSIAASELRSAGSRGVPDAPAILDATTVIPVLQQVAALQDQAELLATGIDAAVRNSGTWADAVRDLLAANTSYARAASDPADLGRDPDELIARWRAELAPLEAYTAAATAAATVTGLGGLADAHRRYAEANLAWAHEAITLLTAGRIEDYNDRLAEVSAETRSQQLADAITAATAEAASSPAIEAVSLERRRLLSFLQALDELRRSTPRQLAPAPTPRPEASGG